MQTYETHGKLVTGIFKKHNSKIKCYQKLVSYLMVETFFVITSCIQAILQYLKCVKCIFMNESRTKFNKKRTIYQNPLPPNLFRLISISSAYGSDNYTSPYFKTNHSIVNYMLAVIISKAHSKLWSLGRFFISPHFISFVFQGLPL